MAKPRTRGAYEASKKVVLASADYWKDTPNALVLQEKSLVDRFGLTPAAARATAELAVAVPL